MESHTEISELDEGSTFQQTLLSQCESVNLRFILTDGHSPETCPSILLAAFQLCEEQECGPEWISESEFLSVSNAGKRDIFVLDPFEGKAFNHAAMLCNSKCVVIGPRCLTYCFMHKLAIPEYLQPMHNMAMHNIVVTCTGLNKMLRDKIKNLIQYMAGHYVNDFSASVTHLVADTVQSPKYRVAQERELPVMKPSWVMAVWDVMGGTSSSDEGIIATDHKFLSHVCPVFMTHCICVSQLPKKDKIAIKNLVEENGGQYSPQLEMGKSTLLVTTTTNSDKYVSAVRWKVPVVTPDYIYDCVQANYALDVTLYKIKRDASTPTKETKMLPPDVSLCSTIANSTLIGAPALDPTVSFNETLTNAASHSSMSNATIMAGISALDGLSTADTCNSELFLDGCKVYLSGWAEATAAQGGRAEKLRKLLNAGGATRFNQLTETVTHIIMGSFQGDTLFKVKAWSEKPYLVSAAWLVESAKSGRPVEETPFVCFDFNENFIPKMPPKFTAFNDTTLDLNNRENDFNSSNVNRKRPLPGDGSDELPGAKKAPSLSGTSRARPELRQSCASSMAGSEVSLPPIFVGLTFAVSGYEEEVLQELKDSVEAMGGRVVAPVASSAHIDYNIVNVTGEGVFLAHAMHHVTHVFVEDCSTEGQVVELQYQHLPLVLPPEVEAARPLDDVVLTVSVYTGRERQFISHLAQRLGAHVQEMFSRKDNNAKGVKRCTHLICSSGGGDKHQASVRWGIPAVTRDWLLACAQAGRKVPEEPHVAREEEHHALPALQLLQGYLKQHIARCTPSSRDLLMDRLNDSSMIAATPYTPGRVASLRAESSTKGSTSKGDPQLSRVLYTTPGKPTTPSAIRTPDSETLQKLYPIPGRTRNNNDSLEAMKTPDTPYGICWESNPSRRTRKIIKRTLNQLPVPPSEKARQAREEFGKTMLSLIKASMTEDELARARDNELIGNTGEPKRSSLHAEEALDENRDKGLVATETRYDNASPCSVMGNIETAEAEDIVPEDIARDLAELEILAADRDTQTQSYDGHENERPRTTSLSRKRSLTRMRNSRNENEPEPVPLTNAVGTMDFVTGSQCTNIAWVDPADSAARRRLSSAAVAESGDRVSDNDRTLPYDEEAVAEQSDVKPSTSRYKFAFSGLDDQADAMKEIIEGLGGEVHSDVSDVTHMIACRTNRSQRMLSAIAAGKWVLHPAYIYECLDKGAFVQEEAFEWGNPLAAAILPKLKEGEKEQDIAWAAHWWRKTVMAGEVRGAFSGWRALISTRPERALAFTSLLKIGDAQVFSESDFLDHDVASGACLNKAKRISLLRLTAQRRISDSNFPPDLTHCFVELRHSPKFDLALFAKNKVPCLDPVFIHKSLVSAGRLDPEQHCLEEYQNIIANMTECESDKFLVKK
ncbi:DNA topoisomerase 2-binding protein 1-A isoform X2 [Hyalella azteca]|uniref:DNA topoisomerase 2-binding protein 1-A isoform X2 n=1 Tax=Hyalella azteca TaxID=294128 RepID=A0A8B7NWZ5_HYAAZ|nr:DNA topoisomerase 2-binding protein 1-A isoform X2 [Hyalella azteca]